MSYLTLPHLRHAHRGTGHLSQEHCAIVGLAPDQIPSRYWTLYACHPGVSYSIGRKHQIIGVIALSASGLKYSKTRPASGTAR